jgi:5-methyltetrahydrofolate--homocysteine methyltransferase
MGSMLMARGLPPGASPESFNLDKLDILKEIAAQYLTAGADILQTNTFGGSPLKLSSYSLDDKTEIINTNAVIAVKEVAGDRAFVSASCGPSGHLLKPYGTIEPEEMFENFKRQLQPIINAGADIICVETMTDINESIQAIRAARSISTTIPVMATMTFEKTPKGFFTIMGVTVETAARELENAGANVVGSNCGNGIENMVLIAREFKQKSDLPILIQANAGIPELKGITPIYPESPEFMSDHGKELLDLGVAVIGGCCGTTPDHIKAFRRMIDSR